MEDEEFVSELAKAPLVCKVCNEKSFTQREGFFYCNECGTKQEQIRAVEVVDQEETLTKGKVRQKILKTKADTPELTSWECYNYILRGLVEELLTLGAKEELKLMVLQLWAAYLRRLEVAFFSKKQSELPRLGVRFHQRDANIIYNYQTKRRRKRKRTGSKSSFNSSEASHARKHRKSKRDLDASTYSNQSESSKPSSFTRSSQNSSSTSGVTSRAIKIIFSNRARKYLKRKMPKKHLEKHAMDTNQEMTCHNIRMRGSEIGRLDRAVGSMNLKQIYTILAMALNLVGDEIQMCDLIRFIDENQVSARKVFDYFPENIVPHVEKLLLDIKFYSFPVKYTVALLREHASVLAKFLHVKSFKTPDIASLASRYVTDLNLPPEIATYVERLINILPPKMKVHIPFTYPPFEARAMAYIIFVLKLLFGLDGYKEKEISESAAKLNESLTHLDNSLKLFVWDDWVRFIEMRKVIISQYNSNFCRQFNQVPNRTQWLEELSEEFNIQNEQRKLADSDAAAKPNKESHILKDIFSKFGCKDHDDSKFERAELINFPATLLPAHLYLKRILVLEGKLVEIPDFMRVNHAMREVEPFFHVKPLREKLQAHQIKLKVEELPCTENREYVGIFRISDYSELQSKDPFLKANFNITEEKWRQNISDYRINHELEFKNLEPYNEIIMKVNARKRKKLQNLTQSLQNSNEDNTARSRRDSETSKDDGTALSMHSFDLFNEDNMDPSDSINLPAPRRNLNTENLFANLSEDEDTLNLEQSPTQEKWKELNLKISNMDYWILTGQPLKFYSNKKARKDLESKLPRSFFWLLEICAQTLGIEWLVLYEQLLTIEMMFAYGIEELDSFQNCVHFKYDNPIKDINLLLNSHRARW